MKSDGTSRLRLDPWATSSLLQKAIRRSNTLLALQAARELFRYRGKGVFRRLVNIAFEDVGIAAPELVAEVTFFAFHSDARAALDSDLSIIEDLTSRLANAPKDRSTDYLFCYATKTTEGQAEQAALGRLHPFELLEIAADPGKPLLQRAAAVLVTCAHRDKLLKEPLMRLLGELERQSPGSIHGAVQLAAKHGLGSYIAMAPLLWSAFSQSASSEITYRHVLPTMMINGIPSYTFDKHTAVGQRAIAQFARENRAVREALAEHISQTCRTEVALMAAFYTDAMPVRRRLIWSQSDRLQQMGMVADMVSAGCPYEAIPAITQCVWDNLADLDRLRLANLRCNGPSAIDCTGSQAAQKRLSDD